MRGQPPLVLPRENVRCDALGFGRRIPNVGPRLHLRPPIARVIARPFLGRMGKQRRARRSTPTSVVSAFGRHRSRSARASNRGAANRTLRRRQRPMHGRNAARCGNPASTFLSPLLADANVSNQFFRNIDAAHALRGAKASSASYDRSCDCSGERQLKRPMRPLFFRSGAAIVAIRCENE